MNEKNKSTLMTGPLSTPLNTSRICIIGPSVDTDYLGGVATHIRNLKSLSCFQDAVVIDPGSVNSNFKTGRFRIAKAIAGLPKTVLCGGYSHVFINTSIYSSSFIKLLVILAFLPSKKDLEIHVFFHGGKFQSFPPIRTVILKHIFHSPLKKTTAFHFLSSVQLAGFKKIFGNYEADLYANYSMTDQIWDKKHDPSDHILRLLFVGRVVREKGVFELLRAIENIIKGESKIKLSVVGDGSDLQDLIEQSKTLPHDLVTFTGHLSGPQLEDMYRSADVLLLPSYEEAFPYVVIEAMRAGVPIISTAEGALDSLIQDGVTGFKVPSRDVDSIVIAVNKLADNRELLEKISKNCHRYFQKYLSRSAAEAYYMGLIRRKSPANE
jgi:glycosyltransferase involved in cell wall biosynthesis